MKILVIEDNLTAAFVMRNLLARMGHEEPVEVHDGTKAMRLLEERSFDLVFVDWVLPGVAGPDIVRAMRGSPRHQGTTIIMTTTKDQPDDLLEALHAGIDDYMLKPVSLAVLEAKLERHARTAS